MKRLRRYVVGGSLLVLGFSAGLLANHRSSAEAQTENRVFELRIATLTTKEKLGVLIDRFRDGELKIWEKHGMEGVGFWVPTSDSPKSEHTLIYMLAHESRDKADESWANFSMIQNGRRSRRYGILARSPSTERTLSLWIFRLSSSVTRPERTRLWCPPAAPPG